MRLIKPIKTAFAPENRSQINRRAFLRGAGTLAIGLPFLESMPSRSAWAQNAQPTFGFFLCHSCGVVADSFWPSDAGPLTQDGLAGSGKAVSALADYADRLLLVGGIRFPGSNRGCGHAQGLAQVLTGADSNGGGGSSASSTKASADWEISEAVNPSGVDGLNLYAGLKGGYIMEKLSFTGPGSVRSAEGNPYEIYKDLTGLAGSTPATPAPADPGEMEAIVDELAVRRSSVNDHVREELNNLMAQSVLSQNDKARLQRHFDGIRDLETSMAAQGLVIGCSSEGLNEADFAAFDDGRSHRDNGSQENVSILHMQLVAFAFACNLNRVAALQVGDGTDATVYDVPSNSRRWGLHYVSHRTQSDGATGDDQMAAAAHAEIDALRMENFKKGIDAFASYATATGNLLDHSFMLWTNHINDGPSHSYSNIPTVLVGSGGGLLRQGEYVSLGGGGGGGFGGGGGGVTNDQLLDTLQAACGVSGVSTLADIVVA